MTKTVHITLPEIEAAILLEYADRVSTTETFASKAEEVVFWRLIAALEKEVSITFRDDYESILSEGKAKIELEAK